MNDAHGGGGKVAAAKYGNGCRTCEHVVRLHFVTAVFSGHKQLAEIPIGAALPSEKIGDKLDGGWHETIPRRAVDRQGALAVFKPGRLDERGEVSAVIHMEVSE